MGQKPSEILIEKSRNLQNRLSNDELDDEEVGGQLKSVVEEFVSRSATGSLSMDPNRLEKLNLDQPVKNELLDAQSSLFREALNDKNVRALGFEEEEDFPIERNSFAERAIVRSRKIIEELPKTEWRVTTNRIRVTSPNFDKEDQSYRQWKGQNSAGQNILFEVYDEEFWLKLKTSELEFGEATEIVVQLATQFEDGRQKRSRVLRVLQFDGQVIAEPLSEGALGAMLGSFSQEGDDEIGLFGLD